MKYKVTCWYSTDVNKDKLVPAQVDFEAEEIENNRSLGAVHDLAELKILAKVSSTEKGPKTLQGVVVWKLDEFGFWEPIKMEDSFSLGGL